MGSWGDGVSVADEGDEGGFSACGFFAFGAFVVFAVVGIFFVVIIVVVVVVGEFSGERAGGGFAAGGSVGVVEYELSSSENGFC